MGDDFYVRAKLHFTVNANGEMTVDNLETNVDPCRYANPGGETLA